MDHVPQELLFLSLRGIALEHATDGPAQRLSVAVHHVQLDSQLWSTPYPSILYPLRRGPGLDGHSAAAGRQSDDDEGGFFSLSTEFVLQQGMVLVPLLKVRILPFDVNIEGTIISRLSNLLSAAAGALGAEGAREEGPLHPVSRPPAVPALEADADTPSVPPPSASRALVSAVLLDLAAPLVSAPPPQPKVFIEALDFSEVRFNLSLNLEVMKGHDNFLERHVFTHTQSVWLNALKTVLLAAVSTISKIDNCQFRFSAYRNADVSSSEDELLRRLTRHYAMQMAVAAVQLLGSFDFMGNPMELFRTLGEVRRCLATLSSLGRVSLH